MKFVSDKNKAAANVRKHGVSFKDAEGVFDDSYALESYQRRRGEDRWKRVGHSGSKLLTVAYTETMDGAIRIISAREATNDEKKHYRNR